MFDSRWIHHIDSGGQPQFLDAIPLMYRSPSHFIVVMRLTEGLDEKPKVRFFIKGEDAYILPDNLVQTNREMIIRICQIAQSVSRSTESKFKPRVFIVGTHLDQFWFFNRSKRLREINEQLVPVHKMFEDVIICKSENEIILPFNTMAKGKNVSNTLKSSKNLSCQQQKILVNQQKFLKMADISSGTGPK